jgi:hypothetical protein
MTARFEDLDPKSQAKIRQMVANAPPLSPRQRARLEMLFSATDPEAGG